VTFSCFWKHGKRCVGATSEYIGQFSEGPHFLLSKHDGKPLADLCAAETLMEMKCPLSKERGQ
jgi:hypothetical protein